MEANVIAVHTKVEATARRVRLKEELYNMLDRLTCK